VGLRKGSPKTAMQMKEVEGGRYSVPVVLSTFRILDELAKTDGLGLNEITQKTGVAKSTAFRILATLLELGYVLRRNSKYSVTNRLATLTNEQATSETIRRVALPYMFRLRDVFGETINLGVCAWTRLSTSTWLPASTRCGLVGSPALACRSTPAR
jgi:hypothetical protein